jgi:hypothetical protein
VFADHLAKHLDAITGPVILADEAKRFIDYMRRHYAAELDVWFAERQTWLVAEEMRHHLHADRSRARAHAGARAFAEHHNLSDVPEDDTFATRYCINEDNVWKSVSDMTGDDHRYVAREYEKTGRRALARAAFHEVIAKKVGAKRTVEVMSVTEYERLLREIEGT